MLLSNGEKQKQSQTIHIIKLHPPAHHMMLLVGKKGNPRINNCWPQWRDSYSTCPLIEKVLTIKGRDVPRHDMVPKDMAAG